jgi:hypothetical protein
MSFVDVYDQFSARLQGTYECLSRSPNVRRVLKDAETVHVVEALCGKWKRVDVGLGYREILV